MNFTTSDGLNLFYTTTGDPADPALVLVHGLGADYRMYAPQVEAFAAAGWHVITPDLRGHGQSAAVAVFAVADCARDMAELLDHLGIAQAAFAGVSLGGLVVQQVAVDHPDRVTRLVVVDSYSSTRGLTRKLAGWTAAAMFRLLPRNTLIGIMLGISTTDAQIDILKLAAGMVNMFPTVLLIGTIGLMLTTIRATRSFAGPLAAAIIAVSYFVNSFAEMADSAFLSFLRNFSFYKYYTPFTVLTKGVDIANLMVIVVTLAVLFGLSLFFFQQRDLST